MFREVAYAFLYFGKFIGQKIIIDAGKTFRRGNETGKDLHQRRFSCPIRAQKSNDLTFFYGKAYFIKNFLISVKFRYFLYGNRHFNTFFKDKLIKNEPIGLLEC